jgi:hypothetical protein
MSAKLTVDLDDLRAVLASCPVPPKSVATTDRDKLPAVHLLADHDHQQLVVTTQNQDSRLRGRVPAQVEAGGQQALPHSILRSWVDSVDRSRRARIKMTEAMRSDDDKQPKDRAPGQAVVISLPDKAGGAAQLSSGTSRVQMPTLVEYDEYDFGHPTSPPWQVDATQVTQALRACASVSGNPFVAQRMAGVHLMLNSGQLVVEGSDGRQVVRYLISTQYDADQVQGRVPSWWAPVWELGIKLDQHLNQPADRLGMWIDPKRGHIWVRTNTWLSVSVGLGGDYPNLDTAAWDCKKATKSWVMHTKAFQAAVEEVAAGDARRVHLRFSGGELHVSGSDSSGCLAATSIPQMMPGPDSDGRFEVLADNIISQLNFFPDQTIYLGQMDGKSSLQLWSESAHQFGWMAALVLPEEANNDRFTDA